MREGLLNAVLNTLLPGDGVDWPAADGLSLGPRMLELAATGPLGRRPVDRILAALPGTFTKLPVAAREATLEAIEIAAPEDFAVLLTAAYSAYYTDPRVRDIIEARTGYPNRPPQPLGYELEPFDERLLDPVKARGPIWRPVPEE